MATEIERKFIPDVRGLIFDPDQGGGVRIVQGYVALDTSGTEVRVRQMGDQTYLTVKSGKGLTRTEVEMEISTKQFEELWPLTAGRRVEKVRYLAPFQGHDVELDVYEGPLEGLFVAEVEFDSPSAAAAYQVPGWFLSEVTDDARYKNKNLAVDGRPQ